MLAGCGPVLKPRRSSWISFAKPAAVAAAAFGVFASGAAFAQTMMVTPTGGGSVTYDTGASVTPSNGALNGGGLTINNSPNISFTGLNIDSSGRYVSSLQTLNFSNELNSYTDLTVNSAGTNSIFNSGNSGAATVFFNAANVMADLGAPTITGGSNALLIFAQGGDLRFTTTGGQISSVTGAEGFFVGGNATITNGSTLSTTYSYSNYDSAALDLNSNGGSANITNNGAITAAGIGIRAETDGGAPTVLTVNNSGAISAQVDGIVANALYGGAVSVTTTGTIDAAGNGIYAYGGDGTAGTFLVNVNAAIGATQAPQRGVYAIAAAGDVTANTVNVNANISSTGESVYSAGAGVTVNIANGVTASSSGSEVINSDGSGDLAVKNYGSLLSNGYAGVYKQAETCPLRTTARA